MAYLFALVSVSLTGEQSPLVSAIACGFPGTSVHAEPFSYAAWGSMGTSS